MSDPDSSPRCPLNYDCSSPELCDIFGVGIEGDRVEEARTIGFTAQLDIVHEKTYTFIDLCGGVIDKGLNPAATTLERFVADETGEEFDIVKNAKRNRSMLDYIRHWDATDAMSRAVKELRRGSI
jgi:hypothetical protein